MKTLFLLFTLLLSGQAFANENIQGTMNDYVNKLIKQNGFLPVVHLGKILKLDIKKSSKYPDGFHSGVKSNGHLHASCADFVDSKGVKYDIDFLVSKSNSGYEVVQPIVHSINGKKNKYDLDH